MFLDLTQAYPRLVKRAMVALIPLATSYVCESGFSALLAIKTKQRNRLDVKDDMRVALSGDSKGGPGLAMSPQIFAWPPVWPPSFFGKEFSSERVEAAYIARKIVVIYNY